MMQILTGRGRNVGLAAQAGFNPGLVASLVLKLQDDFSNVHLLILHEINLDPAKLL
jgi:hypothetical protein